MTKRKKIISIYVSMISIALILPVIFFPDLEDPLIRIEVLVFSIFIVIAMIFDYFDWNIRIRIWYIYITSVRALYSYGALTLIVFLGLYQGFFQINNPFEINYFLLNILSIITTITAAIITKPLAKQLGHGRLKRRKEVCPNCGAKKEAGHSICLTCGHAFSKEN